MKRITICLAVILAAIAALSFTTNASALGTCLTGNGTLHCYETGHLSGEHPRSLIFSAQLSASMKRGFATAEGWATWPSSGGQFGEWIETGLMVWPAGEKGDLRPHEFYATEHAGAFYAVIEPFPARTATAPRYYFAVSDEQSDGCYAVHDLLSPESGAFGWKGTLARYCGRPGTVEYSSVGGELEVEESTRVRGQTETALSNEENGQRYIAAWWQWPEWASGYNFTNPEVIAWRNSEGGPGSVGWRTALLPGEAAAAASTTASTASTVIGMTVKTGTKLAAKLKLTAPNGHKPTGTYRATIHNAAGQTTAEYVGNAYPNEAAVIKGGTG